MGDLMLCSGVSLVMHIAPQLFTKQMTDSKFLMKFYKEALHVQIFSQEISAYSTQYPELHAPTHPNSQVDNALYYYTDSECKNMEALLIDWACIGGMPFVMPLSNNLVSGAEPRMLEEHFDDIVGAWVDAYHEAGGSQRLDFKLVSTMVKLGMCVGAGGLMGFTRIIQNNLPPLDPMWKSFKDRWDPRINDNYVRRATIAQCNHVLEAWMSKKLNMYGTFQQWLKDNQDILIKKDVPDPAVPSPPRGPKPKAKAKA